MKRTAKPVLLAVVIAALCSACVADYGYPSNGYYGPPAYAPAGGGGPSGNPYGFENDNSNFAPYHGDGERIEPLPQ